MAGRSPQAALQILATIAVSSVIGVLEVLPVLIAVYTFTQLVLAPLGLADRDPTDNDGPMAGIIFGIILPVLLLVAWLLSTRYFARRTSRPWLIWILGAAALALPTILYVHSKS